MVGEAIKYFMRNGFR